MSNNISPSCEPEPEDTTYMEQWGNDWYPIYEIGDFLNILPDIIEKYISTNEKKHYYPIGKIVKIIENKYVKIKCYNYVEKKSILIQVPMKELDKTMLCGLDEELIKKFNKIDKKVQ